MNDFLSHDVKKFQKRRARRRVWHSVLTVLASIVVFATTYALILPAITMTAVHVHDESCYTQVTTTEKEILACPVSAESGLVVVHRHDSHCYDEDGMLACPLPELAAHTHTADCYEYPEAHVHTDACYSEERGELICGLEEGEEHTHTDDCYAWETVLSCGQTEEEPAEPVLVCGKKEIVLHRHDEDCYAADGTLTCALPEVIEHQHTGNCFKTVQVPVDTQALTCTNTDPDHAHTALCYGTWVLTCDQGTDDTTPDTPADKEPGTEGSADKEAGTEGSADKEPGTEGSADKEPGTEGPADEEPGADETPAPDADRSELNGGTSDGTEPAPEDGMDVTTQDERSAATVTLKYYVYLDGRLHLISEDRVSLPVENKRHYITAEALEAVYGLYGFQADTYSGERIFPHTDHNSPDKIWADAPAYQEAREDGTLEWRIPLSSRNTSYIYYLPHNQEGYGSYCTTSVSNDDAAIISDNTFYTVHVSAPPEAASESRIYYALGAESFCVELAPVAGHTWHVFNLVNGAELTPDCTETLETGKTRYTFHSVSCPIKISTEQSTTGTHTYTICYRAETLAANFKHISNELNEATLRVVTDGTVGGRSALTEQLEVTADTLYQLRSPDQLYTVAESDRNGQEKKVYYAFRGWRVKATGEILDPDAALTAMQLSACESGGVIQLDAIWDAQDEKGNIASVNFYLNLKCEIKDFHSNGFTSGNISEYTSSVFATAVLGTNELGFLQNDYLLLAPPTTEDTAYDVDATLRKITDTAYKGVSLLEFPSDSEIFARIRESGYTVQIGGQDIPQQYLTSDYFQIRWAVLKYHFSDGWHVDGVLVAKEAKLRVTKTFLGSAAAIASVKAQTGGMEYGIRIQNTTTNAEELLLTLNPAGQEQRTDCVGYDDYDAASNTYTWIVSGRVDSIYALSEQNYLLQDVPSTSYYRILDMAKPGDWQNYDADSQLTTAMVSYATDTPKNRYRTVSFRNKYVEAGTLTLRKFDSFTHNGIANVEFLLTADDGVSGQHLHRKPGTSMYTNTSTSGSEYTEATGNRIVTDVNGDAYLRLTPGAYTLQETLPTGYSGAAEVRFTVDEEGSLTALTFDGAPAASSPGGVASGVGTTLLAIMNDSQVLTTVTAVKDWGEVPDEWRKPVKVTLMCDGAPLGGANSEYTRVLSADNNWTCVWENLPLFLDGKVADYTLREIMIGDTPFDSTLQDGYSEYAVTHEPARYREGDAGDYKDPATWVDGSGERHYAKHVLLTVHNRPDGDVGKITVTKLFASIDGKKLEKIDGTYTFALYKSPDAAGTPVATASVIYGNGTITPEDGIVRFEGLTLGKTYYVFELDDSGRPVPDGETRIISGMPCSAFGGGTAVALSPEHPGGEAEITNRINYAELPETGGHGAHAIYAAGGVLLACALTLLLLQKRRRGRG